ncbi:hypothetical protein ERJ75_001305500 [Trypanosoma vivax]|nr:hypothetical protein ERJ75_001305500 [Trypanosoma vivax]
MRVRFNTATPGGLKADAPDKDKKVHTIGRVRRFRALAIRCVRTCPWCRMSRQAPERWCTRRRVGVRRWSFELGRLRAAIARSVWRLKRLVDVIEQSKTHGTRVVAFTGSLSPLMALSAGPAVVEDATLWRVWTLMLRTCCIFHFAGISAWRLLV